MAVYISRYRLVPYDKRYINLIISGDHLHIDFVRDLFLCAREIEFRNHYTFLPHVLNGIFVSVLLRKLLRNLFMHFLRDISK